MPVRRDRSYGDGQTETRDRDDDTTSVVGVRAGNGGDGRDVRMTSPAAAGFGPDGPAMHFPGRHSCNSGSSQTNKEFISNSPLGWEVSSTKA